MNYLRKFTLATLAIGLLSAIILPCYAQDGQTAKKGKQSFHRKRLAVIQFEIPESVYGGWGDNGEAGADRLSAMLPDMFITPLVQSGAFDVMERSELEKIMKEKELQATDLVDPASIAKNAKLIGVDYILGGKLTEFGVKEKNIGAGAWLPGGGGGLGVKNSKARAVIDARLIDVQTGKIVMAMKGSSENSEKGLSAEGTNYGDYFGNIDFSSNEWTSSRIGKATRESVDQIIDKMLEMFPPQANVRLVLPEGTLILDMGKFAGIKVGDKFDVSHVNQITDPDTGEVLFDEKKLIGTYTVTEVQDNTCKASSAKGTSDVKPAKGDVAVLKRKK